MPIEPKPNDKRTPTANSSEDNASFSAPPVVLVVEPDPAFRRLVKFFLEEAGYAVGFADDGYAALDSVRLNQPAVLITELLLPRLDGLALCRLLKADPVTSDVPILVYTVMDAQARAREAGANAFMKKPIEKKRLLDLVSSLRPPQSVPEDA